MVTTKQLYVLECVTWSQPNNGIFESVVTWSQPNVYNSVYMGLVIYKKNSHNKI